MKKTKSLISILLSIAMLVTLLPFPSFAVSAESEEIYSDGVWQYKIDGDHAVLVGVTELQYGEFCGPPSCLGGYPLKVISGINCGALAGIHTNQFIIPQGVEVITQSAFNTGLFTSVVMPLSLKLIDFNAFPNCYGFNTVYYEGTSEDWDKISISYPGLSNAWSINATRYYNYDYNARYDVDKYNVDATDYIAIHSAFSEFINDQLIRDNYGFYEQIWEYELSNHRKWWCNRLGAYKAWDTLGDIGKVASFKIDGYSLSVDYYELFLNDLVMAMNNKTIQERVKIKSMENYSKYYGVLEKVFKTTNEWDYSITHSSGVEIEIKNYLFDPDYKMSDGARSVFNSLLREAFTEKKEEIITQVFEGFAGAKALCDEVSTSLDIVNVFIEGYNKYILAKSYCEVSPEFFDVLDKAIGKMNNRTYAGWLQEDLNKMKNISTIDIFFDVIKTLHWEGGVFVYDTFVKSALNNIAINYLSSLTGYSPSVFGIAVFTYNTTYMLLDAVSGLSKEAEPYYFMNYIAPLEKALCEVEYEYGETLRENQTTENAVKYDYAYSILKQTELYLFQCAYDFSKTKYQHSWSGDKSAGYYEDMKIISIYQDLWTKLNCHNGTYSCLSSNKAIIDSLQQNSPESNEVASVFFSATTCQLAMNQKTKNVATAYPTYASGQKITYETSDPSIARVNHDGTIIPVSEGTVTITATSVNGTEAICQVTIFPFEVSERSDYLSIDSYTGNKNEVTIPEYINDKPVKEINDYAFYSSEFLPRVFIPESVTSISSNAFNESIAGELIICGVWGSYAHQYAVKNGFTFECDNRERHVVSMDVQSIPTLYAGMDEAIDDMILLVTFDDQTTQTVPAAFCFVEGFDANVCGEQEIRVATYDDFTISVLVLVVKRPISLVNCEIAVQQYINDGTRFEPTPVLTWSPNGDELLLGRDCIITYRDNNTIGMATMIVSGIGYYSGTLAIPFIIYCEHTYEEELVPATCETDGYDRRICSVCGDRLETILIKNGHNYQDDRCTVCGRVRSLIPNGTPIVDSVLDVSFQPSNSLNLNDGDMETYWRSAMSGENEENMAWFGISWDEKVELNEISVFYLDEISIASEDGYFVEISQDGETWERIEFTGLRGNAADTIYLDNPVRTRAVRIVVIGRDDAKDTIEVREMSVSYAIPRGDCTFDGQTGAADLTVMARHVGGIELLFDIKRALLTCDFDNDGVFGADDLTRLARLVAHIDE